MATEQRTSEPTTGFGVHRQDVQDDLTAMASVIGRKWHLVIIHQLDQQPMGFSALQSEIEGISSKVLSTHLQDLEEKGLVDRAVVSERPFRVEYSLTEDGESFRPIIAAVRDGRIDFP